MKLLERHIFSQDWITLTIGACLLILTLVKWVYKNEFNHLLTAAFSDRYIKVSRNENPNHLLRISIIIVYVISLTLWEIKLSFIDGNTNLDFETFILTLTIISVFIMGKRYLSMMVASLMKFDQILELIEYHRNTYRAILGIFLLLLNLCIYYIFPESSTYIWIASYISIAIFFAYNIIILYTYSKGLIKEGFYFILYLCTLEIAPYLLLYKYFMLLRAY